MTIEAERVDFVAIPVRDKDRAAQFYGETLGLERDPHSNAAWPEFRLGNVTISIVVPEQIGWPMVNTPPGAIAIRVPDVADARAKLEAEGVEFMGDSFDSGVCHMAFFKDPDGNGLMLHHRYAPYHDGSNP
jgi:predicted enzyme related to lactoylglutathione lyase